MGKLVRSILVLVVSAWGGWFLVYKAGLWTWAIEEGIVGLETYPVEPWIPPAVATAFALTIATGFWFMVATISNKANP